MQETEVGGLRSKVDLDKSIKPYLKNNVKPKGTGGLAHVVEYPHSKSKGT
jgi:hypothetical protein